jgi:putative ABC transport system substrate-binding protein
MNNRRKLVIALGISALAAPLACFAQQQSKVWRVGFLLPLSRRYSPQSEVFGPFLRGMSELGYVEGKNLVIEWRFADSKVVRADKVIE